MKNDVFDELLRSEKQKGDNQLSRMAKEALIFCTTFFIVDIILIVIYILHKETLELICMSAVFGIVCAYGIYFNLKELNSIQKPKEKEVQ